MSMRFHRWAKTWIEDNITPGVNPDLQSYESRAKQMMQKMSAEAAAAKFSDFEIAEERERIAPLVFAAVADDTDFDIDAYTLKFLLAQENEDGD